MPDPLFTIGIPTFNRAEYLLQSLQAALDQTYANLQILVCDNASTDETAAVVEQFGDPRIDYQRSGTNEGSQRNFARAVDAAKGEYFSWLQDDDLISPTFVSRAVEVLAEQQAGTYLGTAVYSPTIEFFHRPSLYGPPFRLDWMRGAPSLVDPGTIVGLSYLVSVAIPPVVAFRTELLRNSVTTLRESNFPLFLERTILCEAAAAAPVVADPRVCGIFRQHGQQASVEWCSDQGRFQSEWNCMAEFLESSASAMPSGNLSQLKECFLGISKPALRSWLTSSALWPREYETAQAVRQLLLDAAKCRDVHEAATGGGDVALKYWIRQVMPPAIYSVISKLANRQAR